MAGWRAKRRPDRSGRAVVTVTVLALLLVAAVPVALLAGVIMMILGHVVGGLALFGGTILASGLAVALAGISGVRRLRKLASEQRFGLGPLVDGQFTDVEEPEDGGYTNVVQLDRSEYSEVP